VRNSSLVEWSCAENVTGLKRNTEAAAFSRFDIRDSKFERGIDMIKSYKDLEVYKKSYKTALELHQISFNFPKHELYELGSLDRCSRYAVRSSIQVILSGHA